MIFWRLVIVSGLLSLAVVVDRSSGDNAVFAVMLSALVATAAFRARRR